jgi:hypothetical protein
VVAIDPISSAAFSAFRPSVIGLIAAAFFPEAGCPLGMWI